MKLRPTASPDHDPSITGRMIDAAIDNQSTLPLKSSLLQPSGRRKVSLFVSTALGKVVLCSTVAAASISGVALTTDRITLEVLPVDQPAATTVLHADPPTTTTAAAAGEPTTTTIAAPDADAATDESPTELRGCEFGQATADIASDGRSRPDDHPLADHDPCDRSANPTPGGPPDRSDDGPGANPGGNSGGNGNGNAGGNGNGNGRPG